MRPYVSTMHTNTGTARLITFAAPLPTLARSRREFALGQRDWRATMRFVVEKYDDQAGGTGLLAPGASLSTTMPTSSASHADHVRLGVHGDASPAAASGLLAGGGGGTHNYGEIAGASPERNGAQPGVRRRRIALDGIDLSCWQSWTSQQWQLYRQTRRIENHIQDSVGGGASNDGEEETDDVRGSDSVVPSVTAAALASIDQQEKGALDAQTQIVSVENTKKHLTVPQKGSHTTSASRSSSRGSNGSRGRGSSQDAGRVSIRDRSLSVVLNAGNNIIGAFSGQGFSGRLIPAAKTVARGGSGKSLPHTPKSGGRRGPASPSSAAMRKHDAWLHSIAKSALRAELANVDTGASAAVRSVAVDATKKERRRKRGGAGRRRVPRAKEFTDRLYGHYVKKQLRSARAQRFNDNFERHWKRRLRPYEDNACDRSWARLNLKQRWRGAQRSGENYTLLAASVAARRGPEANLSELSAASLAVKGPECMYPRAGYVDEEAMEGALAASLSGTRLRESSEQIDPTVALTLRPSAPSTSGSGVSPSHSAAHHSDADDLLLLPYHRLYHKYLFYHFAEHEAVAMRAAAKRVFDRAGEYATEKEMLDAAEAAAYNAVPPTSTTAVSVACHESPVRAARQVASTGQMLPTVKLPVAERVVLPEALTERNPFPPSAVLVDPSSVTASAAARAVLEKRHLGAERRRSAWLRSASAVAAAETLGVTAVADEKNSSTVMAKRQAGQQRRERDSARLKPAYVNIPEVLRYVSNVACEPVYRQHIELEERQARDGGKLVVSTTAAERSSSLDGCSSNTALFGRSQKSRGGGSHGDCHLPASTERRRRQGGGILPCGGGTQPEERIKPDYRVLHSLRAAPLRRIALVSRQQRVAALASSLESARMSADEKSRRVVR